MLYKDLIPVRILGLVSFYFLNSQMLWKELIVNVLFKAGNNSFLNYGLFTLPTILNGFTSFGQIWQKFSSWYLQCPLCLEIQSNSKTKTHSRFHYEFSFTLFIRALIFVQCIRMFSGIVLTKLILPEC